MKHYRQHKQTDELEDKFVYPHVMAMTSENLRSKAEIAEELGYRDMQIMGLRDQIEAMHKAWDKNQAFDQDLLHECSNENAKLRKQVASAKADGIREAINHVGKLENSAGSILSYYLNLLKYVDKLESKN